MNAASSSIKVMLVDDSVAIRGALRRILDTDPEIEIVASIGNGEKAVDTAAALHPDVIILDVEMPVMDGLTALPLIQEKSPNSKVIMFSTLTERGVDVSIKAMSLGAVECLVKPKSGQAGPNSDFERMMLAVIKNVAPPPSERTPAKAKPAAMTMTKTAPETTADSAPPRLRPDSEIYTGAPDLMAIGSSTGGPQALFKVIKHFKDFPVPIVVTQHMPATFTKILAEHIAQHTGLKAREGADGMRLNAGEVYVAPGGRHMVFEKTGDGTVIRLDDGPPENFCKPAVDPMLRSAIAIYGKRVLFAVLTGMGSDGFKAGEQLAALGGRLIAQDQATSVVWGMPGAVARAGLCNAVLPLEEIGPFIRKAVLG